MTSRRRSSAAICRRWPIPTTTTKHIKNQRQSERSCYGHRQAATRFWMCRRAANISMPPWDNGGFRIYDIANIDDKDFSQRMITAPVSPLGPALLCADKIRDGGRHAHHARRRSRCARSFRRTKSRRSHLIYGFLYVADKEEGLVVVGDPNLKSKEARCGHAARWRSREQLPQARRDLQSGWSSERRAPHHHRGHVCLHPVRSRAGGCGSRQSAASRRSPRKSARHSWSIRRGIADSVPLRVCGRSRRAESSRRDSS